MCQRQILDIRWWAHVSNAESLQRSGLSTIGDILRRRRLSVFGHVARLDPGVPAQWWSASDDGHLYEGRKPMVSWRRPPCRPGNVWLNKVQEDTSALLLSTLRRSKIVRGHGVAQRSTRTTRRRRWCWWFTAYLLQWAKVAPKCRSAHNTSTVNKSIRLSERSVVALNAVTGTINWFGSGLVYLFFNITILKFTFTFTSVELTGIRHTALSRLLFSH